MLRGVLGNRLGLVMGAVKAIPQALGVLSQMASQRAGGATGGVRIVATCLRDSAGAFPLAPRRRLNTTVSETRAFTSVSLPLAEINAVRRRHHASLNDAVLMICSGALRRHFLVHGPLPRKAMVAGVPVSTCAKGDTASNNQATMAVVSLGTH
jgi:hypothetical protein